MEFKTCNRIEKLRRSIVYFSLGLGVTYAVGTIVSIVQSWLFISANEITSAFPTLVAIHITPIAHLFQLFALAAFAHFMPIMSERNIERYSLVLFAVFIVTGFAAFFGNLFSELHIFRANISTQAMLFRSIDIQSIILAGISAITFISFRQSRETREEIAEII